MALLIERKALGRTDGIIAADLAARMTALEAEQTYLDDGSFDLHQMRLWIDEYAALAARGGEIVGLACEDRTIQTAAGPVAVRIHNPEERSPTLAYIHGGGWVMGGLRSHEHIARWIAAETGGRVVQIAYSLAPEHPYPAALLEIVAVLGVLIAEARGVPIMVGGDSAGANLAAAAILRLPAGLRASIGGFVSIYGAYAPEMNLSSHRLYGDGRFGLSEPQMRAFWNLYAPQLLPEARAKELSPLSSDLTGFPPTLCIGAECDLLLDDTLAFYGELTKAGVDVSLSLWPSLPHGCLHFAGAVPSVTEAAGSIVQFVRARGRGQGGRPAAPALAPSAVHGAVDVPAADTAGTDLVDVEPLFASGRSRLHKSLAHRIAAGIIKGDAAAGSLLPREESANDAFGVSRSAYREAIRTLAAKGMVSAQPKVGTRVTPRAAWHILDPDVLEWYFDLAPDEAFIRDLFEVRKIVEPSAAALAAQRRNDLELSQLADALSRMARTSPRSGAWLNAIVAFHRDVMAAGRNEALFSLWPAIQTTLRWSIRLQMMLPTLSLSHDPVADHARVFEKIASQSAEGALTETALLVDAALADTLTHLERIRAVRKA